MKSIDVITGVLQARTSMLAALNYFFEVYKHRTPSANRFLNRTFL